MPKVMKVYCKNCNSLLTARAIPQKKGFSSDIPSPHIITQGNQKQFDLCQCQTVDIACGNCKQICGHHVTKGCQGCLSAKNNGHYWIFMKGDGEYTDLQWNSAAALPM